MVHRLWLMPSGRDTSTLADEVRSLLAFGAVLILSAWLFFSIFEDVVTGDSLVQVDVAAFQWLQSIRTTWLDLLMVSATELGDTVVVTSLATVVFLYFAWQRDFRTGLYWLAAVAGASLLNSAIKVALHRARPTEMPYLGWSAYSFPSGHSTVNLVAYCFLALIIGANFRITGRILLIGLAAVTISLIAFSRLYLGAHWLSDVVGGMAFGAAWFAILGYFYRRGRTPQFERPRLFLILIATLTVAGGGNIYLHHSSDLVLYSVKSDVTRMLPNIDLK